MPLTITLDDPILKTECLLGEGPIWDPRTNELHFLDILKHKVYHWEPATGALKIDQFDEPIGCLALRKRGGLACAAKRGFAIIKYIDQQPTLKYLSRPLEHDPDRENAQRFNDGACDARGRFFAGTLETLDPPYAGQLWCFDPLVGEGKARLVDGDIHESNGTGWSPDGKIYYCTDSDAKRRAIFAYDYDVEIGYVSNRRVHIDASDVGKETKATPDGLCIDSEGGIWSASWAGGRVTRFAPDGSINVTVSIPSAWNVTACCFGGPNLDQLYITTASALAPGGDLSADLDFAAVQAQHPNSGNLFTVDLAGKFRDGGWRHEFAG